MHPIGIRRRSRRHSRHHHHHQFTLASVRNDTLRRYTATHKHTINAHTHTHTQHTTIFWDAIKNEDTKPRQQPSKVELIVVVVATDAKLAFRAKIGGWPGAPHRHNCSTEAMKYWE